MKKIAPYVGNKQGSMLMLTLIIFMVTLILGMTMITTMLYSQGENTMQINEQKAYYAAQSTVEAIKSYFLNPTSEFINTTDITSPHDLIGTNNLKTQGIDEDTTVIINITDEGAVPNETSKNYILIEATGICKEEQSTVKARIIEEVHEGVVGGVYDSQVVFGSSSLLINGVSKDIVVKGDIYVNTQDIEFQNEINNLKMTKTENHNSILYLRNLSEKFNLLTNSILTDAYIETQGPMQITQIKEADNIYFRYIGSDSNNGFTFINNVVNGDAQLYLGKLLPNVNTNIINGRFIFGFNRDNLGWRWISNKRTNEFYIKGVGELSSSGSVSVEPGGSIGDIYIDSKTKISEGSGFKLNPADWGGLEYQSISLSYLDLQEQQITTAISRLDRIGEVLKTKPNWDKQTISSTYPKMEQKGNGVLSKDPLNYEFEEYYDTTTSTRWVFTNDNHGIAQGYTIMNRKDYTGSNDSRVYYISNNSVHKNDTIFFINHNMNNVLINPSSSTRLESFYVYTPNSECSFQSDFEYFGGGIIAKQIKLTANRPKEIEFKAASERIKVNGAPSLSEDFNSSGGSTETTYSYKFESYVD